jgi:hypothetical protein
MKSWIQLFADTVHTYYGVPIEVATGEDNTFFGLEHHPLDLDGPWPILALLQDRVRPDVVIFQVFSVLPEALELESFNPLTGKGGYLSLNQQELAGLVSLLQMYAQQLPPARRSTQSMFGKIEDSRLSDFHLHPEWFPHTKRYHYYQIYDPLAESTESSIDTILILSTGHTGPPEVPSNLFFQIAQFPKQALQDQSFTPLDHALSRIHLDRSGMQELASLLQAHLDQLYG